MKGFKLADGSLSTDYKVGDFFCGITTDSDIGTEEITLIEHGHDKALFKSRMLGDVWVNWYWLKPVSKWSIYNNTKPMSELTDEQAAELFNAWRSGEEVEYFYGVWNTANIPLWIHYIPFRIKQKSEREAFVEEATWALHSLTVSQASDIYYAIKSGKIKAPAVTNEEE